MTYVSRIFWGTSLQAHACESRICTQHLITRIPIKPTECLVQGIGEYWSTTSCALLTFLREQDKEATVYIGNIDERVTDALVWELMLQAGRIVNVHLPKDRVTQSHQGYGFVEFVSEEDAEYAARIMNQVRLYGKPIRVNKVRSGPLELQFYAC